MHKKLVLVCLLLASCGGGSKSTPKPDLCFSTCDCDFAQGMACVSGTCVRYDDVTCVSGADCVEGAYCDHATSRCAVFADCTSRCDDGVFDDRKESDVDCGGACSACGAGRRCAGAADCLSGECLDNACTEPLPPAVTITSPSVDASCGETCTGGIVRAATTRLTFFGTAADPNGLVDGSVILRIMRGSTEVVSATVPASPEWSYAWETSALADEGTFYTFTATATDTRGETSEVSRKVYVDRVAPTVVSSVANNRRLFGLEDTVVTFSEPMDQASVAAAAIPVAGLVSSDGIEFHYTELLHYEPYEFSLAETAKDKAGNPVDAVPTPSAFLTAPLPLPEDPPLVTADAGQDPLLGLDADGNPIVVFTTAGGDLQLNYWDGKTGFVEGPRYTSFTNPPKAVDLRVESTIGADLRLSRKVRILITAYVTAGSHYLFYAESTDMGSFTGIAGSGGIDSLSLHANEVTDTYLPQFVSVNKGIQLCAGCPTLPFRALGISLPNPAGEVCYITIDGSVTPPQFTACSTPTYTPTSPSAVSGQAIVDDGEVFYVELEPAGSAATSLSANDIIAYADNYPFGLGLGGTLFTPKAYLFGLHAYTINSGGFMQFYADVWLACSETPGTAGTWSSSILQATSGIGGTHSAFDLTVSSQAVAVAHAYYPIVSIPKSVSFAVLDTETACDALAGEYEPRVISSAEAPSIALDPRDGISPVVAYRDLSGATEVIRVTR